MSTFPPTRVFAFQAETNSSSSILKLLNAIFIEEKPNAVFEVTIDGIKVVVQKNKVVQQTAYISKDCFSHYYFNHDGVLAFTVDLRHLLKCLGVLSDATGGSEYSTSGDQSRLRHSIGTEYKSLKIRLETGCSALELVVDDESETDNQIRCTLATQDLGSPLALFPPYDPENVDAKMMIKSEVLLELWEDLDHTSEKLWLTMSKGDSVFTMITKSEIAEVELTLGSGNVLNFECGPESVTLCFRLSLFKMVVKSIDLSNKAMVMFMKDGCVIIHCSILEDEGTAEQVQWVEYICSSLSQDEQEDFKIAAHFRQSLTTNR